MKSIVKEQDERDAILARHDFFTLNLPISIFRDKDGKPYSICVSPRKEQVYNNCDEPFKDDKEFKDYCDAAIAAYENAVILFRMLRDKQIDSIYQFDSPRNYLIEIARAKHPGLRTFQGEAVTLRYPYFLEGERKCPYCPSKDVEDLKISFEGSEFLYACKECRKMFWLR